MKRMFLILATVTALGMSPLFAGELDRNERFDGVSAETVYDPMVKKLFTGIINVATCWIEIPRQLTISVNADGMLVGFPVGLVKAPFMAVTRAAAGVYDTATFISAAPGNFDAIIHPRFAWEVNVIRYVEGNQSAVAGR